MQSIGGVPCEGMSSAVFADSLMGPAGSAVELSLQKAGSTDVSIVRCERQLAVESASGEADTTLASMPAASSGPAALVEAEATQPEKSKVCLIITKEMR